MNSIIEKTMKNLEKNKMKPYYCEKKEDALKLCESLIKEGDTVTHGGSVTLQEIGLTALISNGKYNYLDRTKCSSREEQKELYRKSFFADTYFTSSNAVTENGELYNVDGNSNRVAAIVFGPEQVVVVVGVNKIVENVDKAIERVKTVVAPKNAQRLNMDTYCAKMGKCKSYLNENAEVCDGCGSPQRICCNYVLSAQQRIPDRIKVIIVNEDLGY